MVLKQGASTDRIYSYGYEKLLFEISAYVCQQEEICTQFCSGDTTTLSTNGEYAQKDDENAINITHGFSKDRRPDLKQVVLELLCSQDAGVPLAMKVLDGNASDSAIFKERSEELVKQLNTTEQAKYYIFDSKLYSKENAKNLALLNFITRIPKSIKESKMAVDEAIEHNQWVKLDENNKYFLKNITHYGVNQRWLIVYSKAAANRARKRIEKAIFKENSSIVLQLKKISKLSFCCEKDALLALERLNKPLKYHDILLKSQIEKIKNNKTKDGNDESIYRIISEIVSKTETKEEKINQESCFIITSNVSTEELADHEIINKYKNQNTCIENTGFRFLKDPMFFVSSLFLKKNSRIMSLLSIMMLSLLIYTVAQRRLRKSLEKTKETIPNQIKKPTEQPTIRWIFQLLEGINVIKIISNSIVKVVIEGIDQLKNKILRYFGRKVSETYGLYYQIE